MTPIELKLQEFHTALVTVVNKYQELEVLVKSNSNAYNQAANPLMPQAMMQQQPTVSLPQGDAPSLKVRVVLWEKPNSFSGLFTVVDLSTSQQIAELRIVLMLAKPNANNVALNGYILPKDSNNTNAKMSEISLGSAFVTKNGTELSLEAAVTASPINEHFKVNLVLTPVQRTTDNQPVLEGELICQQHFFNAAVRQQLAQGAPQQQQQPSSLGGLLASPGQPTDFGLLTGQAQPNYSEPSVMDLLN